VHRKDCPNLKSADPARLQVAEWIAEEGGARFKAGIVIKAEEQGVALAAVSGCVAEMKLAITSINGRYDKNNDAIVEVTVSLTNRQDVEVLIKKLLANAKIYDVRRMAN
jgi:GTP pyrophosphokinase